MRLLSYNIHKGIGGRDRLYRIGRIIDVIRHERPDVVCLQEVDRNVRRSRFHDQPKRLAKELGLAAQMYQLNVHLKSGGYGNLILSRWPILIKHHVSLRQNNKKPRGAQLAVIETPKGPLHVVNWHLGLAEMERHWQVRRLLEHRLFGESSHLPTLVTGDCNDWRNTLAAGPFQEHDLEHITHPISRFRSFPAWLAMGALDKAFHNKPVKIDRAHVVRSKLSRRASDHLPLVIDFHISRKW